MTRYERKLFFERLVSLRTAYRAEAHEALDLTMADVMTLAQRAMAQLALADAVTAEATTTSGATGPDAERES